MVIRSEGIEQKACQRLRHVDRAVFERNPILPRPILCRSAGIAGPFLPSTNDAGPSVAISVRKTHWPVACTGRAGGLDVQYHRVSDHHEDRSQIAVDRHGIGNLLRNASPGCVADGSRPAPARPTVWVGRSERIEAARRQCGRAEPDHSRHGVDRITRRPPNPNTGGERAQHGYRHRDFGSPRRPTPDEFRVDRLPLSHAVEPRGRYDDAESDRHRIRPARPGNAHGRPGYAVADCRAAPQRTILHRASANG